MRALDAGADVLSVSCPPARAADRGRRPVRGGDVRRGARVCGAPLKAAGADTVILAAIPLPSDPPILQRVFGRDVTLVFSADETARGRRDAAAEADRRTTSAREGAYSFLTTGDTASFRAMGRRFLQLPIEAVEHAEIAALEAAARRHEGRRTQAGRRAAPARARPGLVFELAHGLSPTRRECSAAMVEEGVPRWIYRQGRGWMTAEYSLLPASTGERAAREAAKGKQGGRTVEIQRLIGRALRSVCDFEALGERTLWLDCDVLQADGGTRCAAITGAYVAASRALDRFGSAKALKGQIVAVSVGVVDGRALLDLDYAEDSRAETDMNVVMTADGLLVEVQATAEREPFSRDELDGLLDLAAGGIEAIVVAQDEAVAAERLSSRLGRRCCGCSSPRASRARSGSSASCATRKGLRTHMLVSLGACVFMLVGVYAWTDWTFSTPSGVVVDPSRIASQIVTGVGFLGAGAIIVRGISVRG